MINIEAPDTIDNVIPDRRTPNRNFHVLISCTLYFQQIKVESPYTLVSG